MESKSRVQSSKSEPILALDKEHYKCQICVHIGIFSELKENKKVSWGCKKCNKTMWTVL